MRRTSHPLSSHASPGPVTVEAQRWLAPGCTAAAICLGSALHISNGFLHPVALLLVTTTLGLTLVATTVPRPERWATQDRSIVRGLASAGILIHAIALFTSAPGLSEFRLGLAVLVALAAALVMRPSAPRTNWLIAGLVLTHAGLGLWVIGQSPSPAIDVFVFQEASAAALARGENPYRLTFPIIQGDQPYYGEGLSLDGRLQFGYPYFPLSLLVTMPGYLLAHDPRVAHLLAIELGALLMAFAQRGGLGAIAAALYLSTPRSLFILEMSWTEPFVVLGLAAVTFSACRHSRLTPWMFGAFVAIKQYLVLALPAAILLTEVRAGIRGIAHLWLRAAVVGTLVTAPFVLWDPAAFLTSVVTLQFSQPFRTDALSYLAWWASLGHTPPSTTIAFAVGAIASVLALWRLPRTPAGFSGAVAVTFLVFFAFNKQAFANYYFFVLGALCVTVAAWTPPKVAD